MLAASIGSIGLVLLLSGGLVKCVTWRSIRRYCPGPSPPWSRLSPFHWLWTGRCGYDLTGHLSSGRAAKDLVLICPECGRSLKKIKELQSCPRHVRWFALGGWFVLGTCLVISLHPVNRKRIVHLIPTIVLFHGEDLLESHWPNRLKGELRRRHSHDLLDQERSLAMIPFYVRDLRDDDVKFNADSARRRLFQFGQVALPALTLALGSDDWQQRQIAADVLRELDASPTSALLDVTLEGLRDDDLPRPRGQYRFTYCFNARSGTKYMLKHIDIAETYLRRGLASNDVQQRLLCASVLGRSGRHESMDKAMPILLEHLADNKQFKDAKLGIRAIEGFGDAALPWLMRYIDDRDTQRRDIARHLVCKRDPESLFEEGILLPPPDLRAYFTTIGQ
ncbi:MAG: hypothetical protein O7G85_03910 [Planctomycetota bacterium]|nr:hypothetical protein [Planctomycetota bacterium]